MRLPDPPCCGLQPHLETQAWSVRFQVLTKNCTTKVRGRGVVSGFCSSLGRPCWPTSLTLRACVQAGGGTFMALIRICTPTDDTQSSPQTNTEPGVPRQESQMAFPSPTLPSLHPRHTQLPPPCMLSKTFSPNNDLSAHVSWVCVWWGLAACRRIRGEAFGSLSAAA